VQHQPEIGFQTKSYALADPAHFLHDPSLGTGERRLGGSQQERAGQADMLQRLADDAGFERADIGGDVW